jgi:hypothetical protein
VASTLLLTTILAATCRRSDVVRKNVIEYIPKEADVKGKTLRGTLNYHRTSMDSTGISAGCLALPNSASTLTSN